MKDEFFPHFDSGSSFFPKDYMAYKWGFPTTNWDGLLQVAGKVSATKVMRKGPLVVWGIGVSSEIVQRWQ